MSVFSKIWHKVTGHDARVAAKESWRNQENGIKELIEQQRNNFEISRRDTQNYINTFLASQALTNQQNLEAQRRTLAQNQQHFDAELAVQREGLAQQQRAMQASLEAAQRQQNNQQAQLQRQLNMQEQNSGQIRQERPDKGVAGTILTGPGGVDLDELDKKKNKKTLLGQ
ncbi:MAG: hypothetical protein Q4A74_01595 [Cardiobacteriaceae bacterium]|nr:hypothetical protein [Cardiobacteriaceae bacterium]